MIDTILSRCYDIIILIISIMGRIISMGKQANNIKRFIITLPSYMMEKHLKDNMELTNDR